MLSAIWDYRSADNRNRTHSWLGKVQIHQSQQPYFLRRVIEVIFAFAVFTNEAAFG
jgi:hypothetical protein